MLFRSGLARSAVVSEVVVVNALHLRQQRDDLRHVGAGGVCGESVLEVVDVDGEGGLHVVLLCGGGGVLLAGSILGVGGACQGGSGDDIFRWGCRGE